jgi:hypothetical protein
MSRSLKVVPLVVLCAVIVAVPSVWANWVQDGVALCTATGGQQFPQITSDGAGGAIVTWMDYRDGHYWYPYAQRVNAAGVVQWTADGVLLCTAVSEHSSPIIVSDGAGGAIVTWEDFGRRAYADVYAQRVNASGAVQWTTEGVALCSAATGDAMSPEITPDGAGGAIVTWYDSRSTQYDIYAQRVDASGAVQWIANGAALCTATENQQNPTITSDGAGGTIVTWEDYRNGISYDIYAQRVNAAGAVQWTANGAAICTATGNQQSPRIASDGAGGAIVTWEDYRSGNYEIYAQRVNASGTVLWTADGVGLCTATGGQQFPQIISNDLGGAIVTWQDCRTGAVNADIYAQRVDASGAVQWTVNGAALCTTLGVQGPYAGIVSDGAGGAIVTWEDQRRGIYDIYAQRVNAAGAVQWTSDGIALSTAWQEQRAPAISSDGAGGAIVTWHDYRSGNHDIYAQSITGVLAPRIYSIKDVPGDQGGKVYLSWYGARYDVLMDSQMSHYSIWRAINPTRAALALENGASSLDDLSKFDLSSGKPVIRVEQATGRTFFWELVESVDALYMEAYGKPVATLFDSTSVCNEYHYFQVVAHTTDPKVFWKSEPDSGYSVDNIIPTPPGGLVGQQVHNPEGLFLSWNAVTENDLLHYLVYRSPTGVSRAMQEDLLATTSDTFYVDETWRWNESYYYRVSAVDVHGNESSFSLLRPEDITGVNPEVPTATYLAQNYPNPFNPTTRIAFELASPAPVSLMIYDPMGRLVRVLVNYELAAGRYEFSWDGRDSQSVSVSSGVYFYRLDAGALTQTRKMILLR